MFGTCCTTRARSEWIPPNVQAAGAGQPESKSWNVPEGPLQSTFVFPAPRASKSGEAAAAAASKSGVAAAAASKSSGQDLFRLVLAYVCACISCGLLAGTAVVVPVLADAGAFSAVCLAENQPVGCSAANAQLLSALVVTTLLPTFGELIGGPLFDRFGGSWLGGVGSLILAGGLFVAGLAVQMFPAFPKQNLLLSYIMVVGLVGAEVGGLLNSFSMTGLIWHYPKRRSLVIALGTSSTQVGAGLVPVLQVLYKRCGINPGTSVLIWALLQCGIATIVFKIIPGHEEYRTEAEKVLGQPLPPIEKKVQMCQKLRCGWQLLMQDIWHHAFLLLALASTFAPLCVWQNAVATIEDAVFDSHQAGEWAADISVYMQSIAALLFAFVLGNLTDRFGLSVMFLIMAVVYLIFCFSFASASWTAVVIASLSNWGYTLLSTNLIRQWLLGFVVPTRFGVAYSLTFVIFIVAVIIYVIGLYVWTSTFPNTSEWQKERWVQPIELSSIVGFVILGAVAMCVSIQSPFPQSLRMTPQDQADLLQMSDQDAKTVPLLQNAEH